MTIETASSAWKPSTAQYLPRHMTTAATSITGRTRSPRCGAPGRRGLPPVTMRTMLASASSAATIAATVTAVGRSLGSSGSSPARGFLVALAAAGVAALDRRRRRRAGRPRTTPRPREPSGLRPPGSSSAGRGSPRTPRRSGGAYGFVAPTGSSVNARSCRAAASGSGASVIARTTTARRRARLDRGRQRVRRRARRSRTMASAPCARRRRRSRARGRASGLGRRRVDGADREVVDVRVGVGRVGLGRCVRRAADDAVGADRRARPRGGVVVLADVHAVGAARPPRGRGGR